jgi:hypothetical protein
MGTNREADYGEKSPRLPLDFLVSDTGYWGVGKTWGEPSVDHKAVAGKLNKPGRDLLVRHVDGEAFVDVRVDLRTQGWASTMKHLMDLGVLRFAGHARNVSKTRITRDGRMVLAHVLASYAEALIYAGYLIEIGAATPAIAKVAAFVAGQNAVDVNSTSTALTEVPDALNESSGKSVIDPPSDSTIARNAIVN